MSSEVLITLLLLILGLIAGTLSGLIGVGGGIIIVPALIFIFGMSQQSAQGTTLALLVPPIGILAALTYYKQGYVDLKWALLIGLGFVIGGWLGAKFAIKLPSATLAKIFGVSVIAIGIKMFLSK